MKKILPFAVLIFLSSMLIFYNFTQIPKNLSFDEVEFGRLALSLDEKPYIPYSPLATGHSTLYFYIILASLKIFGITNFALRLPAALFGILNVILFYLITFKVEPALPAGRRLTLNVKRQNLGQQILNPAIIPFICSVIFLSMHWYLNFARFAFEATFLLFLELMSIYFLLRMQTLVLGAGGERRGAPTSRTYKLVSEAGAGARQAPLPIYLILSGLFAGLAFNSYTPGRIFFLLPLSYLIFKTIKQYNHIAIKQLLIFLIPFLITITPLSLYLTTHRDTRIDQVSYLQSNRLSLQKKAEYFGENIIKTALMFNFKGDLNGRQNYPGKPALNPLLGTLFLTGLFIAMKQWNNNYHKFFFFYFLLSIFPALMTYPWENPHMLRTFTAIPSAVYFMGTALNYLLRRFKHRSAIIVIAVLVIFSSIYELRTYFVYQNQVFPHAFEMKGELKQWIR